MKFSWTEFECGSIFQPLPQRIISWSPVFKTVGGEELESRKEKRYEGAVTTRSGSSLDWAGQASAHRFLQTEPLLEVPLSWFHCVSDNTDLSSTGCSPFNEPNHKGALVLCTNWPTLMTFHPFCPAAIAMIPSSEIAWLQAAEARCHGNRAFRSWENSP